MAEESNISFAKLKVADPKISVEEAAVLEQVLQAVRQIKYGYVQVTIQDGKVIQIDRTEKKRFDYK